MGFGDGEVDLATKERFMRLAHFLKKTDKSLA